MLSKSHFFSRWSVIATCFLSTRVQSSGVLWVSDACQSLPEGKVRQQGVSWIRRHCSIQPIGGFVYIQVPLSLTRLCRWSFGVLESWHYPSLAFVFWKHCSGSRRKSRRRTYFRIILCSRCLSQGRCQWPDRACVWQMKWHYFWTEPSPLFCWSLMGGGGFGMSMRGFHLYTDCGPRWALSHFFPRLQFRISNVSKFEHEGEECAHSVMVWGCRS